MRESRHIYGCGELDVGERRISFTVSYGATDLRRLAHASTCNQPQDTLKVGEMLFF